MYEGINESSRRKVVAALGQFVEVDTHKAVVSVKLLDQHRVVMESVGTRFNLVDVKKSLSQGRTKRTSLEEGVRDVERRP